MSKIPRRGIDPSFSSVSRGEPDYQLFFTPGDWTKSLWCWLKREQSPTPCWHCTARKDARNHWARGRWGNQALVSALRKVYSVCHLTHPPHFLMSSWKWGCVEKKMQKDRGIAPPKGAQCFGEDGFLPGSESRVGVSITDCNLPADQKMLLGSLS